MSEYLQVMTTVGSEEQAKRLQEILVREGAAACVQVLGPISSVYRWEGRMEQATEWICFVKTMAEVYPRIEALIKKNHPYQVPEIIATPIVAGSGEYLGWMSREITTK